MWATVAHRNLKEQFYTDAEFTVESHYNVPGGYHGTLHGRIGFVHLVQGFTVIKFENH